MDSARHHAGAGAFPEIQVAQYPLDMGRSDQSKSNKTLATTVGADGSINFDAIVKQGRNKEKHIATSHNAMVPKLDKLKDEVSPSAFRHWRSCAVHSPLHMHVLPVSSVIQAGELCMQHRSQLVQADVENIKATQAFCDVPWLPIAP